MEKTTPSYWMIADTELEISKSPSQQKSFLSHFKHALLFNDTLMISDAQAVNCSNLRHLIRSNDDFKRLITRDNITIAVRKPEDRDVQDLVEVRDAFYNEHKHHMDDASFLKDEDLVFLQESTTIVPYDYSALRVSFTNTVLQIVNSDYSKLVLGEDTQSILLQLLNKENAKNNGLGRVYLQKNIVDDLKTSGHFEIWQRHQHNILKICDAPYVTGIPKVVKANPIYSPYHAEAFSIIDNTQQELVECGGKLEFDTLLDLSSYSHALSVLSSEDINQLRDSREFREFNACRKLIAERGMDELFASLVEYQRLIDRFILQRKVGEKTLLKRPSNRTIQRVMKFSKDGIMAGVGLVLDPFSSLTLSLLNMLYDERRSAANNKEVILVDVEKSKFLRELKEMALDAKVDAEISFTKDAEERIVYSRA